jgi:uncharacterized short protein YbdD (DUF466 family)
MVAREQNNYIKTSKYTLLTFLPLNVFEQFQRLANFYFLCLLVLQFIPFISSLTPITTAVPLIGVLALTAIKDAYDDFVSNGRRPHPHHPAITRLLFHLRPLQQRHRSDSHVNNRKSHVLRNGKSVEERWHKVQVRMTLVAAGRVPARRKLIEGVRVKSARRADRLPPPGAGSFAYLGRCGRIRRCRLDQILGDCGARWPAPGRQSGAMIEETWPGHSLPNNLDGFTFRLFCLISLWVATRFRLVISSAWKTTNSSPPIS